MAPGCKWLGYGFTVFIYAIVFNEILWWLIIFAWRRSRGDEKHGQANDHANHHQPDIGHRESLPGYVDRTLSKSHAPRRDAQLSFGGKVENFAQLMHPETSSCRGCIIRRRFAQCSLLHAPGRECATEVTSSLFLYRVASGRLGSADGRDWSQAASRRSGLRKR